MKVWTGTKAELEDAELTGCGAVVVDGRPHVWVADGVGWWRPLAEGVLLVWDHRSRGRRQARCLGCMHRRDCWGAGFYAEAYAGCAEGRVDRWVPDTVMLARDERRGRR